MLADPVAAQGGHSDLARAELQRRATAATEARDLLTTGDEAYEAGRYADAAADYRKALDLLPEGAPAIKALRAETVQRYAQASIEVARKQRRLGDVAGAEATINEVLVDGIAPQHPSALQELERINDPIRTNPASTIEHTRDIEEVRQLLYSAEGAYNLGKFDQAEMVYEDVLKVDPTNKAARRGMERVIAAKTDYYRAAYDQTRAELLSQVDAAWELSVPSDDLVARIDETLDGGFAGAGVSEKVSEIVIPAIYLEDVSLAEAIDFLRQQTVALDPEPDPTKKGINMVIDLGGPDSEVAQQIRAIRFNLNLKNVPLSVALDYITDATRTVVVTQAHALAIRPAGADSTDLIFRTYRVPPDFLTAGTVGNGDGGNLAANDPFADEPEEGLLPKRLTAEELLSERGVTFPDGATATFNPGNSTLSVRNTPANHSIVEQVVDLIANSEPTHVIVEIKMIKTQSRRLKELSFDWLLGEFSLGGDSLVPGRAAAYLTGGTQGNGGSLADVALPPGQTSRNPITSGNRSGSEAIGADAIDEQIFAASTGLVRGPARAPGALWINGVINNTNVTMLMRGIDQKSGVDLAAVPSVVTRSGQAASINVSREFIYPTEYEPPEVPNTVGSGQVLIDLDTGQVEQESLGAIPVTPATPTSFETRDVGISMEVLPTVSADKRLVDITLAPNITDFDGFVNYGSPINTTANAGVGGFGIPVEVEITPNRILMPVFSTLTTSTSLTVADGHTIVIGGLMQEKTQKVEDKTPILGDIPFVGRLFQSRAYSPVQTAIVFFVKVRVVDSAGRPFNP